MEYISGEFSMHDDEFDSVEWIELLQKIKQHIRTKKMSWEKFWPFSKNEETL